MNRDHLNWQEKPIRTTTALDSIPLLALAGIACWSICLMITIHSCNKPQDGLGSLQRAIASGKTSGQLNASEQAELGIIRLSHEKVAQMREEGSYSHQSALNQAIGE